jgi:hypothetical protein
MNNKSNSYLIEQRLAAFRLAAGALCIGMIELLRHKAAFPFFFWTAAAAAVCGIFFPAAAGAVFSLLTLLLQWAGSAAVACFYFLIVTPWGLAYRLAHRERRAQADSYWIKHLPGAKPDYTRQY